MYFLKDSLLEIKKMKDNISTKIESFFFWKVNKKRKLLKLFKRKKKASIKSEKEYERLIYK